MLPKIEGYWAFIEYNLLEKMFKAEMVSSPYLYFKTQFELLLNL